MVLHIAMTDSKEIKSWQVSWNFYNKQVEMLICKEIDYTSIKGSEIMTGVLREEVSTW